jgi:hypothetical protein
MPRKQGPVQSKEKKTMSVHEDLAVQYHQIPTIIASLELEQLVKTASQLQLERVIA